MTTIGERLSYIRTQKGLTLEQLAQTAGISKSFLWEVDHVRKNIMISQVREYLKRYKKKHQSYKNHLLNVVTRLGLDRDGDLEMTILLYMLDKVERALANNDIPITYDPVEFIEAVATCLNLE